MIFVDRDTSEGSVISFSRPIDNNDFSILRAIGLSSNEIVQLESLSHAARNSKTSSISYSEIAAILGIKMPSVRKLTKRFVDLGVLNLTDETHPLHRSIKHYRFELKVESPKTSISQVPPAASNAIQRMQGRSGLSSATSDKLKQAYQLAYLYRPQIVVEEERFLSVPDSTLIGAIFSQYIGDEQPNFIDGITFADILPYPTELKKMVGAQQLRYPLQVPNQTDLEVTLNNPSGKLPSIDDIQLLYTLINLTLRFSIDRLKNGLTQASFSIVPIRTADVLSFLKLDPSATANKQMVNEKLKVIASTVFSLSGYTATDVLTEVGRPFFYHRGESCKSYRHAEAQSPFLHIIEWDKDVLKAIYKAKHYFLLPHEVISGDRRLFLLYLYVRRQFSYRNKIELDVTKIRKILGISDHVTPQSLERSLRTVFEKYYKAEHGEAPPKTLPKLVSIPITVAAVKFQLIIDKNNKQSGWNELTIVASYSKLEVLIATQPKSIREQLLSLPEAEQIELLPKLLVGQSKSHPIIHNEHLGVSKIADHIDDEQQEVQNELLLELTSGLQNIGANQLEQFDEINIKQIREELKSINPNSNVAAYLEPESIKNQIEDFVEIVPKSEKMGTMKILKRKYSIDIRVSTEKSITNETIRFKSNPYQSKSELEKIADDISLLTGYTSEHVLNKIESYLKQLPLLQAADLTINLDDFKYICDQINKNISDEKLRIEDKDLFETIIHLIPREMRTVKSLSLDELISRLKCTLNLA